MECNKNEALRAKEIAEKKFLENDLAGARKFALKAQNLFPTIVGISQMIATLDVYCASERKVAGEKDLYAILNVNVAADAETVKKQYRKLALLVHPNRNTFVGADGAFHLISEAWKTLSDESKRASYDKKRNLEGSTVHTSQSPISDTFLASCFKCSRKFEALSSKRNEWILCTQCLDNLTARASKLPPKRQSSVPLSASGQQRRKTASTTASPSAATEAKELKKNSKGAQTTARKK